MSAVTGPVEGEAGQLIVADNSPEQQQQAAQAHAEGISGEYQYGKLVKCKLYNK